MVGMISISTKGIWRDSFVNEIEIVLFDFQSGCCNNFWLEESPECSQILMKFTERDGMEDVVA